MAIALAGAPTATVIQRKDIGLIARAFWLKATRVNYEPNTARIEIGGPLRAFDVLARDIFVEERKASAGGETAARLGYRAEHGVNAANAVEANAISYFDEFEKKTIACIYSAFENESVAFLAKLGKKFDCTLEGVDLPKKVPYKTALDGLFQHYSKRETAMASGAEVDAIEQKENKAYAAEEMLVSRVMGNWKYNIFEKDGEGAVGGNTHGLLYLPAVFENPAESQDDKKLMPYPLDLLMDFRHGRRVFDAAVRNLRKEIPGFFQLLADGIEGAVRAVFRKEIGS